MKRIKEKLEDELFLMDLSFFIGYLMVSITNFMVNFYFGLYFLGISLIILSIFLFRFRKG